MKISIQDQTVVISQLPHEASELTAALVAQQNQWADGNVIIDASGCVLSPLDLFEAISAISANHKSMAKSFVLVDTVPRLKEYPEELSAAPTLEEAFDLIEMEEIERDLGF